MEAEEGNATERKSVKGEVCGREGKSEEMERRGKRMSGERLTGEEMR